MKTSHLLTLSAALAAAGLLLLSGGPAARPHADSARINTLVATTPAAAGTSSPAVPAPAAPATEAGSTDTTAARPSALPTDVLAPNDGPGADHLVQAMLDTHSPHNLPSQVEQHLNQLGRAIFLADLTGQGRAHWPNYFTASGTSRYSRVRIQAATARSIDAGRAEVTLIWAGTSPAGDPEVGLPATVLLAQQGDGAWEPVR